MNKRDLVEFVSKRTTLNKKDVEHVITITLEAIINSIARGEKVMLVGFGSFNIKHKKARQGRNPRTGQLVNIPAKVVPIFSVGKFFRDTVNNSQYL